MLGEHFFAIDFEASCLPIHGRSFPIEVGICDNRGHQRTWLIRPDSRWRDWTWTHEAEGLHTLNRETLIKEGLPCGQVLAELNECLTGSVVVADSILDEGWLATLAQAAEMRPQFGITNLADLLDRMAPTDDAISQADNAVVGLALVRHRAGPDARHLATWLHALDRGSERAVPRFAA